MAFGCGSGVALKNDLAPRSAHGAPPALTVIEVEIAKVGADRIAMIATRLDPDRKAARLAAAAEQARTVTPQVVVDRVAAGSQLEAAAMAGAVIVAMAGA